MKYIKKNGFSRLLSLVLTLVLYFTEISSLNLSFTYAEETNGKITSELKAELERNKDFYDVAEGSFLSCKI